MKNCVKLIAFSLFMFLENRLLAQNQIPKFQNINISANTNRQQITFDFELWDNEEVNLEIALKVSTDHGQSYKNVESSSLSGDIGTNIKIGNEKSKPATIIEF